MAVKRNSADLAKSSEKKTYFSSEYSFSKKAGLKLGVDAYAILLGIEDGYYETRAHRVEGRKINNQQVGFKGNFATNIVCRGYDDEGNKIEGAVCCQLAQLEKDKFPEQKDSNKRMIGFSKPIYHIPVLILSNTETDQSKKIPPTKLSIKKWEFAYLEFPKSQFDKLLADLKEELVNDGSIDVELEGQELYDKLLTELSQTVLKVTGIESNNPKIPYLKSYSFIKFESTALGKLSGEHDDIVGYKNIKEVKNSISDFITIFESSVDDIINGKYTDEELVKYVKNDTERLESVQECVETLKKEEQIVEELVEEDTDSSVESLIDDELNSILDEDDFAFDSDDEDLFSEED